MAFMSPSPAELIVILVIALLVLGPTRLPETARSLGRGMRELRDSLQGAADDEPAFDRSPEKRAGDEDAPYAGDAPYDDDLPDEPDGRPPAPTGSA